MRTKALLLSAAVGAMSVASTLAQVYSVNVVGFVNVNVVQGFNFFANPLKATAETVGAAIPSAPEGTTVATWNKAQQRFNSAATFSFGSWDNANYPLPAGEAFFLNSGEATTLTFVGEVRQGTLSTPLVVGFNLVGSQVAQAGALGDGVTVGLGYVPVEGDTAAKWNPANQRYFSANSYSFGSWDSMPTLNMAEGVVITRSTAGSWTRTFTVQ